MEHPIEIAHPVPELSARDRCALVSCGLWLRVGFIGACASAGVLLELIHGEMGPLSALALAAGAVTLTAVGWWRARVVLEGADGTIAAVAADPSPANSASVCSVA
jgi:hypothetical protein